MCTVVVRWAPGAPVEALALRDELVGRAFDDPARWWPDQPSVVGGRDRVAGGSWCVTDVDSGTTAFVLNRPQRRVAADGAPSRGVLPLLAVAHGAGWPDQLEVDGMASFALLLAGPEALIQWEYDADRLVRTDLEPGTHMVTSGGAEDGKADRFLTAFTAATTVDAWLHLVTGQSPADDAAALVVRHETADTVYATVFGQTISASPGALALRWSRTPWLADTWT